MAEISHKSPIDDIAFLDPLQSQHPVQSTTNPTPTTVTPPSSQYPIITDQNEQHLSSQDRISPIPSTTTSKTARNPYAMSSTSSAYKGKQNDDMFAALVAPSYPSKMSTFSSMHPRDQERSLFDQATHLKSHTNPSKPPPHRRTDSVSSQQSDFGAFVSVPSSDDPLSANLWDFDEEQPPAQVPLVETPTTATAGGSMQARQPAIDSKSDRQPTTSSWPPPLRPSSSTSFSSTSNHTFSSSSQNNSTLSFFDQFSQNAKERSQARSSLLDELLLHQDDPLYFLKDENQPNKPVESGSPAIPLDRPPSLLSPPLIPVPASTPITPLTPTGPTASSTPVMSPTVNVVSSPQPQKHQHSLLDIDLNDDLDHDYFRVASADPQTGPHVAHRQFVLPPHLRSPPTRSSSISVPVPTLAPPLASPEGATRSDAESRSPPAAASYVVSHHLATPPSTSSIDDLAHIASSSLEKDVSGDGNLPRLTKRASFTTLPGKWMSTLLRSTPLPGHAAAQTPPVKPSIESVFESSSGTGDEMATSPSTSANPLPSESSSTSPSTLAAQEPTLHRRSSTSPSRRRTPQHQPTFTHSNPFAPPAPTASVVHGPSPFAPHVYVPPTGAPGFKGEQYTWDKGFSEELEAERERELDSKEVKPGFRANVKAKTVPGVGKENEPQDVVGVAGSLGSGSKGGTGWGSGFGFSFGTIRGGGGNGKGKLAASSSLGSGSSPSPSSSVIASKGSIKSPSTHSAESGSDDSSFFAHERGASSPAEMKYSQELTGGTGRRKAVDVNGKVGGDGDGMGAFIERKSGNVELVGRKAATMPVLTSELAGMIRPHLPALLRLPRSWTLIYSLDQDGISLNTLYTRCEAHATRRPAPGEILTNNAAMLVVMRDADGGVFGAWVADGVRLNKGGRGYFGGGESFLWKYQSDNLKVFKCTGKNNYIALCEPGYISFGGGDGHYGLYLDESLFDGSSAPCPTFNNEPLCSPGPRKGAAVTFECVGLEVWGMGP